MVVTPLEQKRKGAIGSEMFFGKDLRARLTNPHDEFWDKRLGVNTFGFRPARGIASSPNWQVHYTPNPYSSIFYCLDRVGLGHSDIFTDLGSGMGRAVFSASWKGASQSEGVEILRDLSQIAEENRRKSRLSNRNIHFTCADARDVDLSKTTVLYMFHPFGADTLHAVLAKLTESHSPALRIAYVNPVYKDVFKSFAWLKREGLIKPPRHVLSAAKIWHVAFWRAC